MKELGCIFARAGQRIDLFTAEDGDLVLRILSFEDILVTEVRVHREEFGRAAEYLPTTLQEEVQGHDPADA